MIAKTNLIVWLEWFEYSLIEIKINKFIGFINNKLFNFKDKDRGWMGSSNEHFNGLLKKIESTNIFY